MKSEFALEEARQYVEKIESNIKKKSISDVQEVTHALHKLKINISTVARRMKALETERDALFFTDQKYGSTKTHVTVKNNNYPSETYWDNFHNSFLKIYNSILRRDVISELRACEPLKLEEGVNVVKQTLTLKTFTKKVNIMNTREAEYEPYEVVFTILRHGKIEDKPRYKADRE